MDRGTDSGLHSNLLRHKGLKSMKWFILAIVITNNATIPTVKQYAFDTQLDCELYVKRNTGDIQMDMLNIYPNMLSANVSCVTSEVIDNLKKQSDKARKSHSI